MFDLVMGLLSIVLRYSHWVATGYAVLFLAGLLAETLSILPDAEPATGDASLPRPVLLVLGSVLFTGLAIECWRNRLARHRPETASAPIPAARLAEITRWLRRRVDVAEAHAMLRDGSADNNATNEVFDSWHADNACEDDELWYYDTPAESWENLGGENGFALVRDGRVVEFMMWTMN